jgi:DNA-binding GntR family transcriptional regulator
MTDGQRLDRESLATQAAARLRHEILSGAAPPGTRILVRDLVERWGVSHIPIREALRELEAESLIESRPRQGVVVARVDIDELGDLYRLRRLLEVDAVRRGFGTFTDDHVRRARHALDELLALTPQQRDGNWWAAHQRYHWAFLEPGLSPWATKLLQLLWQSCERYQRLYTLVFGSVDDANREHHRILDAAAGDDVDAFLEAWLQHLDHTERTVACGYRARHA